MKTRKAFTLVEIMIVVVIIALAAAILIPAIQSINRPGATGSVAAAQPIVGRFVATPDERINGYYVSIITDTKTKREYLVMYYNDSLCVRPLLGADDLAEQVERNSNR